MEPSETLAYEIYREKVLRARAMTEAERLAAGPQLFDFACEWTKAGIRMDEPNLDEYEVLERLRARLLLAEKLESTS